MPRFFDQEVPESAVTSGVGKQVKEKKGQERKEALPDPGPLPVDAKKYRQHVRGKYTLNPKLAARHPVHRKRLSHVKERQKKAVVKAVRSEVLLTEEAGYIEADDNEETYQISQKEIQENVDITAASKHFDLDLAFGPYKLDIFRNGRQLLIGGRKGHVACFDWLTKELKSEFNVQESVHDVQYLHLPNMFAVAQKDWVYIYDDCGMELHCLRKMYHVQHLDFLPYHFLLVSATDNGFLTWLDVSMGEVVSQYRMDHASNKLTCMTQNRTNAIMHTGHPNGTVALWSPNSTKPLVKMLANPSTVRGIAVDPSGRYMATAGVDRSLKIFDLRTYKCAYNYKLRSVPGSLSFSQTGMLSVGVGDVVEVYKGICRKEIESPYLRHRLSGSHKVTDCSFVNYEDVLGVAHEHGYTSLLIPGSGEANFDAYESNPFMTTSQKREIEVKALLEKIAPDLISLDPRSLAQVDVDGIARDQEAARDQLHVKIRKIDLKRKKAKRGNLAKRKENLRELKNRERIEKLKHLQDEVTARQQQAEERHDGAAAGENNHRSHLSPSTAAGAPDPQSPASRARQKQQRKTDSESKVKDIYSRFKSRA